MTPSSFLLNRHFLEHRVIFRRSRRHDHVVVSHCLCLEHGKLLRVHQGAVSYLFGSFSMSALCISVRHHSGKSRIVGSIGCLAEATPLWRRIASSLVSRRMVAESHRFWRSSALKLKASLVSISPLIIHYIQQYRIFIHIPLHMIPLQQSLLYYPAFQCVRGFISAPKKESTKGSFHRSTFNIYRSGPIDSWIEPHLVSSPS
jgi:hypothetical protein